MTERLERLLSNFCVVATPKFLDRFCNPLNVRDDEKPAVLLPQGVTSNYNLGQKGLRILKTGVILRTTSSISHIISDPPPPYN